MAQYEQQNTESGVQKGNFSRIEETTWQLSHNDGWKLPFIEQLIMSAARGALVFCGGFPIIWAVARWLSDVFWPTFLLFLWGGGTYAVYDFQHHIDDIFETHRAQELTRKTYENETATAEMDKSERCTIETIYRDSAGNARTIEYDDFPTSKQNLAILYREFSQGHIKMSKSGVRKALGVGDSKAASILDALEKKNYIQYMGSRNAPNGANYTNKGKVVSTQLVTWLLTLEQEMSIEG